MRAEDDVPERLDVLFGKHGDEVAALRAEGIAEGVFAEGDEVCEDIWLLKYVLSFVLRSKQGVVEGRKDALKALRATVTWRARHAEVIRGIREAVAAGVPFDEDRIPHGRRCEVYSLAEVYKGGPDVHGCPVFMIRSGLTNSRAMMDNIPRDVLLDWMLLRREFCLAELERGPYAAGVLGKVVFVNDLNHVSFWNGMDSRFQKILGEMSKLSENLYPQLMDRAVLVNPPSFMRVLFAAVKPLLSKKVLEKMAICPGFRSGKTNVADCPYASRRFRAEHLPTFVGGGCRVMVGGISNEQTAVVAERDDEGYELVTVAAGRKHEIALDVGADAWNGGSMDKDISAMMSELQVDGGEGGDAGDTAEALHATAPAPASEDSEAAQGKRFALDFQFDVNQGIEFSVWFRPGFSAVEQRGTQAEFDEETKCIFPARKIKADQCPFKGHVLLPSYAGVVYMVFDNRYSWVYSKHLRVMASIVDR